jgi:selenophosphate synthetase-related protein
MNWDFGNRSDHDYIENERDITIIDLGNGEQGYYLIISCDVSGGIGSQKGDFVQTSGEIIGSFTTRVALMEVLAVGASPISVINTLTTSFEKGGQEIIQGIKEKVEEI